ncbi:MAG TPA: zinc-dependent alcohol dehydrogenase family protein [Mucilaginibacter sp.]|nr:zinc-dependent alcohol dehydrogenase family protein [Mucilaginibacter sp.]
MKAIQLKAYGDPLENVGVVEINDIGTINHDEVVIEVLYSPVNPSDLLLMRGTYPIQPELPSVIGGEGVGRVASIGSSVSTVKPGDIVTIPFGTFAWSEKVVAKAADLVVLPANVDLQQAAMLSINPPTAVLLLEEFVSLNSGDWVVLNAANASVSHTIIAVAKSKGIKTLGIVRRKEAVDIALKAGADVVLIEDENVVSEAKKATNNAEIKLSLDAVGGKATNTLVQILANEGRLVSYSMMSGEPMNVSQIGLIFRRIQIHGFFMYLPHYLPKLKNAILQSVQLLAQGKLNVPIAEIYPPERVKEALKHTISGGKVLLQFNA